MLSKRYINIIYDFISAKKGEKRRKGTKSAGEGDRTDVEGLDVREGLDAEDAKPALRSQKNSTNCENYL